VLAQTTQCSTGPRHPGHTLICCQDCQAWHIDDEARMDKKPKLCAYCGLELSAGPVNREHFVSKCFWGGLPLPNAMKVIRVHESCNSGAKDDAEYLRDILVMTAGTPEHRNAKQAVDVAILNKMDYDATQFLKLLGEVRTMPVVTSSGLFVGMGEAFRVDTERRNRALHRIIRGLFFLLAGRPLATDTVFHELDQKTGLALLEGTGMSQSFGDDVFQYRYHLFGEDPNCILVYLRFYQKHTFGFVTITKDFRMPDDSA